MSARMFSELFDRPAEPVCIAAGRSPENKIGYINWAVRLDGMQIFIIVLTND